MYEVVKIKRKVLISPSEVIDNVASGDTLPKNRVLHSIVIAEERFARPFLGWDLYEAMVNAKNRDVTATNINTIKAQLQEVYGSSPIPDIKAGDVLNSSELLPTAYANLWHQYLCKYIAECVKYVAIPESYADFTATGLMKNNPETGFTDTSSSKSVGIGLKDAQWLMDKWMDERMEPFKQAMHNYIVRNISSYPGYPYVAPRPEQPAMPKTSWVDLDIYREQDEPDYGCFEQAPSITPEQNMKSFTETWVTIPGQTQYPYPGQFNEDAIKQRLKGAELLSLTQEGADMYIGAGMGELTGLDVINGVIKWVTPAPDQQPGLRMKAVLQK